MHNIALPSAIVRRTRLFFFTILIATSPLMVVASTRMSSSATPPTGYPNGTPTAQYAISAQGILSSVTDDTATTSSASFDNAITAGATPPTIAGKPATSVLAGQLYAFEPMATGGTGREISFSIAHKPSWASFSIATGELSGTPKTTQIGSYPNITISVSNGQARASLPAFSIAVDASHTPPTISGSPAKSVVAGQAYAFEPKATVEAGKTATFSITDKPAWASFNSSTGELSGTPAAANVGTDANVVINVSDGSTSVALSAFTIAVTEVGTRSATLSWKAPTENSNGSPLTNLAGYRIYFGPSASKLSRTITINSVGITTKVVTDLSPGTYYFALMAFNTAGAESKLSNVVRAKL